VPITIASRDGRDGSLRIRQDVVLQFVRLDEGAQFREALSPERGYWVQVVAGIIGLNGTEMRQGDGAALTEETFLEIDAETEAEVLIFDLR
jgi:redox-sensitive bicupin YhaK (pirin superfamily)